MGSRCGGVGGGDVQGFWQEARSCFMYLIEGDDQCYEKCWKLPYVSSYFILQNLCVVHVTAIAEANPAPTLINVAVLERACDSFFCHAAKICGIPQWMLERS
ncbi:hypothetical protein Tco_0957904, partial [Tanacetum coccineum]